MSGFIQSFPSSPGFSIVPVPGFQYPVQQNPVVYMSSTLPVQFPPPVQPAQSQIFHPQALPSQIGQSMVLIPLPLGHQQLISSQFPQNEVSSSSVPTPPSSSGSGKNSESTTTEPTQTVNSCPTESSNQIHNGGFVKNGEVYYFLEPVSCLQLDQNSTGGIGNVEESSSTIMNNNNSITCQCELCSGHLSSTPSSSSSSSTSSNGVATSQQQHSLPLSSWNFPHHQPTPSVHQYLFYPVQPTPLQFPSFPMSNFDENFCRSSFIRKGAAWTNKVKKNSQSQTPPKPMCGFCKSNREPKEVYRGHWLRNDDGKLVCPGLRKYVCPVCQATGDNAHTIKYCPVAPTSNPSESQSTTKEIKDKELKQCTIEN